MSFSVHQLDPLQPTPLLSLASSLTIGGVTVTAITRVWKEGDPARCRLCRVCRVARDFPVCQVQVSTAVAPEDVALFDFDAFVGAGPRPDLFGRSSEN
ncbi:MAG: hypothetical protein LC745_06980 [Planctomycetia bacterium]|nr:hypothetical protein [Planctomycetia bacterium]